MTTSSAAALRRRSDGLVLGLSFTGFVLMGMSSGMLGVAWPSMRDTFGMPLGAVGLLLAAGTVGIIASSMTVGWALRQMSAGALLMLSCFVGALGLIGYSLLPAWWMVIVAGLLVGAGNGMILAALNVYVAAHHSVRTMNWLHAFYGVGAAFGPLVMTTLLSLSYSWRLGFGLVGAGQVLLGLGIALTLPRWRRGRPVGVDEETDVATAVPVTAWDALKRPLVWLSIVIFFCYTGVEGSTGQWMYTIFTESRAIPLALAGTATSLFWAGLTLGRVTLGSVAERIGTQRLLRLCTLSTIAFTLFLVVPLMPLNLVGVALLGVALGPIFPTLTSDAPRRVSRQFGDFTIGFQTAAASLGIAVLPGLAGVLAENFSLEVIPPFIVVLSVAMFATHEWILRRQRAGKT